MGFLGLIGFGGGATGLGLGGGAASNDPNGHVATGGIISDYSTPTAAYRAHIFNTPGDFVISSLSGEFPAHVEYLVMGGGAGGGGGGGGSQAAGGGGGAGGMKNNVEGPGGGGDVPNSAYASGYPVSAATFPVSIGRGGQRGMRSGSLGPVQPMARAKGAGGGSSYFGPPTVRVEATGGGAGGAGRADTPGLSPGGDGACGGGGGFTNGPQPYSWGGTANRDSGGTPFPGPSQGYGGDSAGATGPTYSGPGAAGGGSGVGGTGGAAPGDPTVEAKGGVGGAGKASVIAYGPTVPLFYGGGGAGGSAPPTGGISQQPLGGSSIGGEGASMRFTPNYSAPNYVAEVQPNTFANNRRDNTGSGGGGGGTGGANENCPGGDGSDGCVIIRYQIGQSDATESRKATGGAVSVYNDKIIHTILYTQNFVTTSAISGAEVFAIGGGGGGGGGNGSCGGGGAGGAVTITDVAFDSGCTYTCTIGIGGQGGYRGDYRGNPGNNTTLAYTSGGPSPAFDGTITANGGGYGGAYGPPVRDGGAGGCGGGAAGGDDGGANNQSNPANPDYSAPQITNHSYAGGDSHAPNYRGGGGGGIGGVGSPGDGSGPRNGGYGAQIPTTFRDPAAAKGGLGMLGHPGASYYVGGGGGGGTETGAPNAEEPADHGKGGAGTGDTGPWSGGGQAGTNTGPWVATPTSGYNGEPGYSNTGGGGGGGWWTDGSVGNSPYGFQGGGGGSGLILIAYPK